MRGGASVAGVSGSNADGTRNYSSDREKAFEAYAADVAATVRSALDQIDLPQWARDQLNALGEGADLDKLSQAAQAIKATQDAFAALQGALEDFGGSFARISALSSDALAGLVGFAGGLDRLQRASRAPPVGWAQKRGRRPL
jgi:hypothetical protein